MADLTADRLGHFQAISALLPALTYVDQLGMAFPNGPSRAFQLAISSLPILN